MRTVRAWVVVSWTALLVSACSQSEPEAVGGEQASLLGAPGCLLPQLASGASLNDARIACACAGLGAWQTIFFGNVTIHTQAQASAFSCIRHVVGTLTFADDPDELSISLPNLRTVTHDLVIVFSRGPTMSFFPDVRFVDLPALTHVGRDLEMSYDGDASDLLTLDVGLPSLAYLGRHLSLELFTFNADLEGLGALPRVHGDVVLESAGDDFTLYGFLSALMRVDGDVVLISGHTTNGVLGGLASVGGSVVVSDVLLPPGADNFLALVSVGGDLVLHDLDLITVMGFDPHFPALTEISGTLDIAHANDLELLSLGDPTGLFVGALDLDANPDLFDLSPALLTVDTIGSIQITNHPTLCSDDVQAFVDTQAALGWMGTATLSGNAECP